MKHNHAILLAALVPLLLVLLTFVLDYNNKIRLMNADNATSTMWGWINYLSYESLSFLTPIVLFAYFAYTFALTHKEPTLTRRLVTFVTAESVVYIVFYYLLWFGGGTYSYYQGGDYIQDGTYFYHWWFSGLLSSFPYLAVNLWIAWPVLATLSVGFLLMRRSE